MKRSPSSCLYGRQRRHVSPIAVGVIVFLMTTPTVFAEPYLVCIFPKKPANAQEGREYHFDLDEKRNEVRDSSGTPYSSVFFEENTIQFQRNGIQFSQDVSRWQLEPKCIKYKNMGSDALSDMYRTNYDNYQWCSQTVYTKTNTGQQRFLINRRTGAFSFLYWVHDEGSLHAVQGWGEGTCSEAKQRF